MSTLLKTIINTIDYIDVKNYRNIPITGVAYHSSKVIPGDIFVCINGYSSDGHKYAKDAMFKGASALVVEKFIKNIDIPQIKVSDSRLSLANLGSMFYNYPSRHLTMIGVTGTNGKTSTTFFIDKILEKAVNKTGLIGTVIVKNVSKSVPAELTTPESLDLQRILSEMKKNRVRHVTMEVSSSGLDLNRVSFINYKIAVVNNISRDHIDLHGSFDSYINAKKKLVSNLDENSYAILNGDCPITLEFGKETKAKIVTFGFKNCLASVVAEDIGLSNNQTTYTLKINEPLNKKNTHLKSQSFEIKLQVLGLHNVYNSLAAATVALALGVDIPTIQQALYEFTGVERRFQLIYNKHFKIFDDHFANPGNITVTLETLKNMCYSKLHLVYSIRGNRGITVNKENAEAVVKYKEELGISHITITTSNDYVTKKDTVTVDELKVVEEIFNNAGITTTIFPSLKGAIVNTINLVEKNSIVLLAGCQGMDYGARIALEHIYEKFSSRKSLSLRELKKEREELFFPLINRVAGV